MGLNSVDASRMAEAIRDILNEYATKDVQNAMDKVANEVAKDAVKYVKQNAPVRKGGRGGSYRKSWTSKNTSGRLKVEAIAYSKNRYQLTHLLEFGHVTRNGGRTQAKPHIATAQTQIDEEFIAKLKQELGGG